MERWPDAVRIYRQLRSLSRQLKKNQEMERSVVSPGPDAQIPVPGGALGVPGGTWDTRAAASSRGRSGCGPESSAQGPLWHGHPLGGADALRVRTRRVAEEAAVLRAELGGAVVTDRVGD